MLCSFFFFSLSQTQLVGIGQPTRALLLLTLVANGPTRARFSLLAHSLVKFPPAGNTEKERERKKRNDSVNNEMSMCKGVIGRWILVFFSFFFFRSVQFSIGVRQLRRR